ncbi:MAG TPA: hypothetical protein VMS17_12660 [Gemmataceae bacterium]|nr:hypothetical protein [Gemmataceae bacterium]
MRKIALTISAVALSLGAWAPAPPDDEARAILERAVKAHGGFERLSRLHADRVTTQGVLIVKDQETPFQTETTVQLPNQLRNVIRLQGEHKTVFVNIFDGDKVYFTLDGQPEKVSDTLATELRETMQLNQAIRLAPLLTDKTYTLEALGELKIDDRSALGVKVTPKSGRELRMFFSKETGLLIKTEHTIDDGGGKEVVQEEMYSNFQDVEGFRRPMKIAVFRNGKKVMEAEVVDVKYLDKVDAAEFAKP